MTQIAVQRVVFPQDIDLPGQESDVLPLYVNGRYMSRALHDLDWAEAPVPPEGLGDSQVTGRRSLRLAPHSTASFDTYFNRVHAGYLVRWTTVRALTLNLSGNGLVRITIRRSTREGRQVVEHVSTMDLADGFSAQVSLAACSAGGCLWFDLESFGQEVELSAADWVAEVKGLHEARVDVAICTYNRPDDALSLIRTLRADQEWLEHVGVVRVIDNGNQHFTDLPGAQAVMDAWGDQLEVIRQPNLGGSGGFSRGMYEAARTGEADYVFLMDDDVVAEPESLRRAVVFAELAVSPLVVGGQMLVRAKPTLLHSSGERVNSRTFIWGEAPLGQEAIPVDREALDVVVDVGFNAWWACMIPVKAIQEHGLSQPFFIKWDDVEYGLRLAEAGIMTVTLPGVAVWHESWDMKDDAIDWTVYFHTRNRLISAAMVSAAVPDEVAKQRFRSIVKHVIVLDVMRNVGRRAFSSADAANQAMADFLAGPDILFRPLDETVAEVRANRKRFPGDEAVVPYTAESRAPKDPKPRRRWTTTVALAREYGFEMPLIPLPIPPSLVKRKRADEWDLWTTPVDRGTVTLPKSADHWWGLMDYPDAAVVTMDGTKAVLRRRDPRAARDLTKQAWRLGRDIMRRYPELMAQYAAARRSAASPEAWEKQWNR